MQIAVVSVWKNALHASQLVFSRPVNKGHLLQVLSCDSGTVLGMAVCWLVSLSDEWSICLVQYEIYQQHLDRFQWFFAQIAMVVLVQNQQVLATGIFYIW